jgi:pimeloyl-ACP methyl ester carboxylesterase
MIAVGETKVQVVIGGQGDPLVVLHGAGGNRGWRRWMAAVAERYTVYAPTHPGFGRSAAADWMESIDDLARFYLWFLDVMGLSKVHLLGHSIGGWTAAELATMRPGAIDRLVLVSPTGLKPDAGEIRDIFFHSPDELLTYTAANQFALKARSVSLSKMSYEELVENYYIVADTPDEVVDRFARVRKELGIGHLLLEAQESRMDHPTTMRSIELMGKRVIPAMAGV